MSELANLASDERHLRWRLLATVSTLTLMGMCVAAEVAAARQGGDNPTVWIDLGGQAELLGGKSDHISPAFFDLTGPENLSPMVDAQRRSPFSIGEQGKLTFTPRGTDLQVSASLRYGRSHAARHLHHQTPQAGLGPIYVGAFYVAKNFYPANFSYGDAQTSSSESHLVLDFQAGKDVGLGLFDHHGSSIISAGVRFAQFNSISDVTLHARPIYTFGFVTSPGRYRLPEPFHANYTAILHAQRSTHAIGPELSWDASVPLVGEHSDTTFNLDWGLNAAVLFGRQRAHVHHQTSGYHYHKYGGFSGTKNVGSYVNAPPDRNRSKSATIPNIGGFAGLSINFTNAKVRIGYRADVFFNAVDVGLDSHSGGDRSFYGPFAIMSIGLGG